ncbi:hypothetical protein HJC23_011934 [Cyclotella cryptica]|uniref:DUF4110 domain-containing protein n=1 Tax=Cyclotella cryptica TaxID=29204 RepID=A0ABD3QQT8_9STRA
MGKDKKKSRDPSKQAALAAKKEAKAEKAALKRITKQNSNVGGVDGEGSEDIDAIVSMMREVNVVEYESLEEFPLPPRGNFTWTLSPTNGMFYMFGGEYYDGAENIVFDDLLRWDPDAKQSSDDENDDIPNNPQDNLHRGQWTRILTPSPRPPPRCAHSAVFYKDAIYIFGGECATAEKYHHYRDMWKLDVKRNIWEEVRARSGNPPVARSGHRAVTWRHYMIVFGGFHESLRAETRFFNDLHIFDFQTCTWTELQYSKLARLPPPRSACNLALGTAPSESLYVYGGYSKVKNVNVPGASKSEGIIHVDCWMLPLKSLVGGLNNGSNPPSWERISRKGEYPSGRAGSSSIVNKNKMLLFGGVFDNEGDHHKMDSVFYDDLFALDMERRRWFALRLKKASGGSGGRRRKKKVTDEEGEQKATEKEEDDSANEDSEEDTEKNDVEAVSSGWDLDKLRHDMFAFIDADGNIVYEKIEDEDAVPDNSSQQREVQDQPALATEIDGEVKSLERVDSGADKRDDKALDQNLLNASAEESSSSIKPRRIPSSAVMKVDNKGIPMPVARQTPLPRINCATVIKGNTLYIYGGVLEVGDREVTLDDCWSIDMNKREKWTCIWPGQMHRQVWKGIDSDNDSYISSDQGAEESDENEEPEEFEPINEEDEDSDEARKLAKKEAKRAAKKAAKAGIRQEISDLKDKLGTDNEQRTPLMGESVAEFYARTTNYWNMEAAKTVGQKATDRGEAMSSKELKGEAFQMAKDRFEEIRPVLERLNELDSMQKEAEENRKEKKKTKAEKKTKKDRLK